MFVEVRAPDTDGNVSSRILAHVVHVFEPVSLLALVAGGVILMNGVSAAQAAVVDGDVAGHAIVAVIVESLWTRIALSGLVVECVAILAFVAPLALALQAPRVLGVALDANGTCTAPLEVVALVFVALAAGENR